MDIATAAYLFLAGVAGGLVNAVAGGATLITFPAMLAAGLPPLVANASNSIAVAPGHLVAALADRERLSSFDTRLIAAVAAALVGGGLGAILLFVTPARWFTAATPILIGLATIIFAAGKNLQNFLPGSFGGPSRPALLGVASVYGGYFGAGLGVILLAVLGLTGREEPRAANALKNLLATAVSLTTLVIFSLSGLVNWTATFVMLAGAVLGGITGGRLISFLPPHVVRGAVIVIGAAMTFIYAARFWF